MSMKSPSIWTLPRMIRDGFLGSEEGISGSGVVVAAVFVFGVPVGEDSCVCGSGGFLLSVLGEGLEALPAGSS